MLDHKRSTYFAKINSAVHDYSFQTIYDPTNLEDTIIIELDHIVPSECYVSSVKGERLDRGIILDELELYDEEQEIEHADINITVEDAGPPISNRSQGMQRVVRNYAWEERVVDINDSYVGEHLLDERAHIVPNPAPLINRGRPQIETPETPSMLSEDSRRAGERVNSVVSFQGDMNENQDQQDNNEGLNSNRDASDYSRRYREYQRNGSGEHNDNNDEDHRHVSNSDMNSRDDSSMLSDNS